MQAKPIQNALTVKSHETLPNGVEVLTLDCTDFAAFKSLPAAVEYNGSQYGRTGWNSDRYVAYYRTDVKAYARATK